MDMVPIGYKAICEQLKLNVLPHYRESYIAKIGRGKTIVENHREIHIYPKIYAIESEQDIYANLEFALKHEGINLEIIRELFEQIEKKELIERIKQQPTGINSRKIWYLYEFLMNERLNLKDIQKIKYVDLLDSKKYFTCKAIKSPRHAINDNLLGNVKFCPTVRRTELLDKYIASQLDDTAKQIFKKYDVYLITRACNYLYTKETMSSYQIEREKPEMNRISRFVSMLQQAHTMESLTKEKLIELQNILVDPRFQDVDYRQTQNYVGENIDPYFQKIHYISPKPEDVLELMNGIFESLNRMMNSQINPVVIAAIVSYGFVFIHPFEDGNGRIHRFLIHYILSKTKFTPKDMIFPVSSVMLQKMADYDAILESFSKPLLSVLTNYSLSAEGMMTVKQESKSFYQYINFTKMAEYLFSCIKDAIYNDMIREIEFLKNYDETKMAMQEVVEMPDNKIDLFIKFVMQNNGKLSAQKQMKYFSLLTEVEIEQFTKIIRENMMKDRL